MEAANQLIMMLLCMLAGYVMCKVKCLTHDSIFPMNKLLINCALPCLIISSVGGIDLELARAQAPVSLALAFVQFALFILITLVMVKLLRVPPKDQAIYYFLNMCTNVGFLCMPVIAAVYGDQTLILSAIFILACNFFTGSIGFALLESSRDGRYGLSKFRIGPKTLQNAPLIASVIALIMLFAGIQLPDVIQSSLKMMGSICTPVAMVIIGVIVATANLKVVFGNWRMYVVSIVRQLVFAAITVVIAAQFISDPLILGTYVLMFAAPAGSFVPVFAINYKQDEILATQGTVVSTMLCFIYFPLLVALVGIL